MKVVIRGNEMAFGHLNIGDGFLLNDDLHLKCDTNTAFNFNKNCLKNIEDDYTTVFYVDCDVVVN